MKKILIVTLGVLVLAMATSSFAFACVEECQQVPEFTTLGAGIALLGAGAYTLYKRSKK